MYFFLEIKNNCIRNIPLLLQKYVQYINKLRNGEKNIPSKLNHTVT